VTIGVGFLCEDGIVLCADNQITWPESHKYYECKIYPHGNDEWSMVNTFAGDPDLAKSFNGKFKDAMNRVERPYTAAKIQDVIETVLSFLDVLDTNSSDLWMLCAIAIPNSTMRLVRTTGKVVSEVSDYSYVGVGDSSLLRHLGQLITGVQLYRPRRADHAYMLGTYLVLKAKTHVEGCGGDTDAFVLRPSGHVEIRSGDYYRTEQQMLRIESKIKVVASCFFDKRIADSDFDKVVAELVRVLKEDHHEVSSRMWA
jgi:hypothetical protein